MASYENAYNESIAKRQHLLDIANLKNDYDNSMDLPLHGGDFWSDFADGFMSVMKPVGQIASVVAPFLGAGESGGMYDKSKYGAGYSGGDMSVNAPYEGYVYGKGMSGGAVANDGQPPFNYPANAGMSGGAMTYEQNMNMADAMGDIFSGMGQRGGGQSGGSWAIARLLAPELSIPYDLATGKNPLTGETWGSGAPSAGELSDTDPLKMRHPEVLASAFLGGRNPRSVPKKEKKRMLQKAIADLMLQKQLMNLHGKGLSGGKMRGGDFDWSSLLPLAPLLLGLGLSGGEGNEDMDLVEPLVMGMGMSGGDFWSDLGTVASQVAPFLPLLGLGQSGGAKMRGCGESGGEYAGNVLVNSGDKQLYKGGQVPRSNVNQPYLGAGESGGAWYDDLWSGIKKVGEVVKEVAPMVEQGVKVYDTVQKVRGKKGEGRKKKQTKQDKMNESLSMKIAHLKGKGMEPIGDIEKANDAVVNMSVNNPEVDRKVGGKKSSKWIDHVKSYAKQHGLKYSEALKQAKSTYRS